MGYPPLMSPVKVRSFVALLLPPALAEPLRALQLDIRDRFHSRAALRSPPHLTLVAPFECEREELAGLDEWLSLAVLSQRSFEVVLDGFACFAPRVIFLAPEPSLPLSRLNEALQGPLAGRYPFVKPPHRPFHPHVTLAYKDLAPGRFRTAWAEFEGRAYSARWIADTVTRLEHEEGKWRVRREYPMG